MTNEIYFRKVDEVYTRILANQSILQEFVDEFTFKAPNYIHHPLYKKRDGKGQRIWNGDIKLIKKGLVYTGLLPELMAFADSRGYPFDFSSEYGDCGIDITPDEIVEFIESLELPENKLPYGKYDYQLVTFAKAIRAGRALLLSPTGSGKSILAYMLTRFYDCKSLIITDGTQLVAQLASDFASYGYTEPVYQIMAGVDKTNIPELITVSTWQSLMNQDESWYDQFDFILVDEAHKAKAKVLTKIMESTKSIPNKFGMTGSLDDSKVNGLVLQGLFGEVIKEVTTKELIERKVLSELQITAILLKYPEVYRKEFTKNGKFTLDYADEANFLFAYKKRNKFICNLALNLEGNTLILFTKKEKHGYKLKELLTNSSKPVYYVDGDVDVEVREQIRNIIEKEKNAIILASVVFATGINIINLSNIIFASPTKSIIRVLQSIGRGLRRAEGSKEKCHLFDIGDDLSWNPKSINHTLRHFKRRIEIYNEQDFDYTIVNREI